MHRFLLVVFFLVGSPLVARGELCLARKSGTLKLRVVCKRGEAKVDPSTLGIVTSGPPGERGATGPIGPTAGLSMATCRP